MTKSKPILERDLQEYKIYGKIKNVIKTITNILQFMSEKQTLLQLGREKLNNSVPEFLQTEVSMKGLKGLKVLRNLAIAGLVSSASIVSLEGINKNAPLSPEQMLIASSSIEKVGLGKPSQLSEVLKNNSRGATIRQISQQRADLITSNPETSKEISNKLMESFYANPNPDNTIALYQALGEQNPQLKGKFDLAITELGANPESNPINLDEIALTIATISGGLLVLKGAKDLKQHIQESKKLPITPAEVIPNQGQAAMIKSEDIGDETILKNFNPKHIKYSTNKTMEEISSNAKEVEGIKEDLSTYLKILNQTYHSKETLKDKVKIDYVYKFVNTLKAEINSTQDLETIKNLKKVAKLVIKSLLKNPDTINLDAENLYNYISSKESKLSSLIPKEVFDKAQKQGLSAIYNLQQ